MKVDSLVVIGYFGVVLSFDWLFPGSFTRAA